MSGIAPGQVAKWQVSAFAGALLCFLWWIAWTHGGNLLAGAIYSMFLTCWLSGPAAAAALLANTSRLGWTSWCYVFAETTLICSTVWLLVPLFLFPDAQNGIALMFLPLLQYMGLLMYALSVALVRMIVGRARSSST